MLASWTIDLTKLVHPARIARLSLYHARRMVAHVFTLFGTGNENIWHTTEFFSHVFSRIGSQETFSSFSVSFALSMHHRFMAEKYISKPIGVEEWVA